MAIYGDNLTVFPFLPEKSSYVYQKQSGVISTDIAGGLSRSRLDLVGTASLVNCQWIFTAEEYEYFQYFFRFIAKEASNSFICPLILDKRTQQDFICKFVVDSIELSQPSAFSFIVTASLEVEPLVYDEVDEFLAFVAIRAEMEGSTVEDVLSDLLNVSTFDQELLALAFGDYFAPYVAKLTFTGEDDSYWTIAGLDSNLFVDAFTVEFEGSFGNNNEAFLSRNNFVSFSILSYSGNVTFGRSAGWVQSPVPANTPAKFRFVYDPALSGTDRYKIYINGNRAIGTQNGDISSAHLPSSADLYVGRRQSNTYKLNGYMQNLKIWSSAVLPTSIDQKTGLVVDGTHVFGSNLVNNGSGSDITLHYDIIPYELKSKLRILTPVNYQGIQKQGSTTNVPIKGYFGKDLEVIEARYDSQDYVDLTTVVNGYFSATLTVPTGVRSIDVRVKGYPEQTNITIANVVIGDGYLVSGDSISEGRVSNTQSHGLGASLKPSVLRQDQFWKELNDPADTGSNLGSHWPLLARMLSEDSGEPVWFVTTGTGGKDIIGSGVAYYNKGNPGFDLIENQAANAGSVTGILLHLGPNAATDASVTDSQYSTALETFAVDLRTDVQTNVPVWIGCYGRSTGFNNDPIRKGIVDRLAVSSNLQAGCNLLGIAFGDGVHPKTDQHAAIVAGRWFAALKGTVSPNVSGHTIIDAVTVDLDFDADLNTTVTNYVTSAWEVKTASVAQTITSVTRTGVRKIRIVISGALAVGSTVSFAKGETHLNGVIPTSSLVNLPSTVNTISSVAQPINPIYDYVL